LVASELQRLADGRWLNVGSFHNRTVEMFRERAPRISTAASQKDVAALYFGRLMPSPLKRRLLNKAHGEVLQIPRSWMALPLDTKKFITFVQQESRYAMYWTINESDAMMELLQRGANGIVSDEVLTARKVIDEFNSSD